MFATTDQGANGSRQGATTRVGAPSAHPDLAAQQEFAARQQAVLRRAKVSGDRLVVTLALVLERHAAAEVVIDGRRQLRCVVCGPAGAATDDRFPCFTAQHAVWALEGVLR